MRICNISYEIFSPENHGPLVDRVQLQLEARKHVSDHEPEHLLEEPRVRLFLPEHVVEQPRAEEERVWLAGGALGRHGDGVQHRVYPVSLLLGGEIRGYRRFVCRRFQEIAGDLMPLLQ